MLHTYDQSTDHHYLDKLLPRHGIPILARNANEAFIQPLYPYGNGMVCIRRCWTETCLRGAYRSKRRLITQTSHVCWNREYTQNVNRNGERYIRDLVQHDNIANLGITWNSQHACTYTDFACWIQPRTRNGLVIVEQQDTLCPFLLQRTSKPDHYQRLREYFRLFILMHEEQGFSPSAFALVRETALVIEGMEKRARQEDVELWQGMDPIFLGV